MATYKKPTSQAEKNTHQIKINSIDYSLKVEKSLKLRKAICFLTRKRQMSTQQDKAQG